MRVYTPRKEEVLLPKGSTPVDFAYEISPGIKGSVDQGVSQLDLWVSFRYSL